MCKIKWTATMHSLDKNLTFTFVWPLKSYIMSVTSFLGVVELAFPVSLQVILLAECYHNKEY